MPHFTTSDGLSLYYTDQGSGTPVICLAGLTRNSGDFDFMAPHLSDVRLIRLDYRGRGQSDYASDFMTYSIPQEAADVIALMDHLHLKDAVIIGTSRGGLIAMTLAAMQPQRLRAVLLNDIGPDIAEIGITRIMAYVGHEPQFPDYDAASIGLLAAYQQDFPDVPRERWRIQAELMWYEKPGGGLGLRYDARLRDALLAQAEATKDAPPDLWPLFDALKTIPLTALRGENSDLLSAESFQKMQARLPHMQAITVPNRAHVPFLDEPASLTAIHDLLDRAK